MSLAFSEVIRRNTIQPSAAGRVVLQYHDYARLPAQPWEVRVMSGCAWITYAGQDILLNNGDILSSKTVFALGNDQAVISALGKTPLVVDIRTLPDGDK
jgi:hypothetical protein